MTLAIIVIVVSTLAALYLSYEIGHEIGWSRAVKALAKKEGWR